MPYFRFPLSLDLLAERGIRGGILTKWSSSGKEILAVARVLADRLAEWPLRRV